MWFQKIKLRIKPLNFSNPILNLTFFKQTYFKSINFFFEKNFQSNNFMTSIYDLNSLKK